MEKKYVLISGLKLAGVRTLKGLTQKEFADKVGISRPTVVTWEGKSSLRIPEDKMKLILQALKCDIEDLTKDASIGNTGNTKGTDVLDSPLVKSYVEQINLQREMIEILKGEIATLKRRLGE